MATQLGQVEIRSIEGTIVKGWFGAAMRRTYTAPILAGARACWHDAFSSLCDLNRSESDLRPCIKERHVHESQRRIDRVHHRGHRPQRPSGLETGHWDSTAG